MITKNNTLIKPKFSVIIPTFNRSEPLRRCLISLVDQTFKSFEVIVCDDGSNDDTYSIVEQFSSSLQLSYNYKENWGGPAQPRNTGISMARGEFICFLDSDDWWYPNKLSECMDYIDEADFIYHKLTTYDANGKVKKKIINARQVNDYIALDLMLNGNAIPNSSVTIRSSIVKEVGYFSEDKRLIAVEDMDYWIRTANITSRFHFIDKSLGGYWVGGENISLSSNHLRRELALYDKHSKGLDLEMQDEVFKRLSYRLGRMSQKSGDPLNAVHYFYRSMFCSKLNIVLKSVYFIFILKCRFIKTLFSNN